MKLGATYRAASAAAVLIAIWSSSGWASSGRTIDLELHSALSSAADRLATEDEADPVAPAGISAGCLSSPLPTTPTGETRTVSNRDLPSYAFDAVLWRQPCVNDGTRSAVLMRVTPFGTAGAWICSASWYAVQNGVTRTSPMWVTSNNGSSICQTYYSAVTVALNQWSIYTNFDDQAAFSLRHSWLTLSPSSIEIPASGPGTRHLLTVQVTGTGSGTVSSSPSGVSCRTGSCSAEYGQGTTVTLTATPDGTHAFSRWGGDCSGTSRTVTVTISAARTCTARFTPPPVHPETGWWWNASEPGTGYFVEVQRSSAFLSAYMYDDAGKATWFIANGTFAGGAFAGSLQEFWGGQPMGGSWRQADFAADRGQVTLRLTGTGTGVLTLPSGRQVGLARFAF